MNPFESNTHSFILKVWLEETAEEAGQATWRGHITHVQSGVRRYVQDLADVTTFITPYLQSMGVQPVSPWRIRRWLKRLKLFR